MHRSVVDLAAPEQDFVELLAGSQPGELDLNRAVGTGGEEAGDLGNPDRLPMSSTSL